jgi:hypothetical protein
VPIEVEIHQKSSNDDNSSECDGRDFNFDLFNSFGMTNPMKLSVGFSLFDSIKNPMPLQPIVFETKMLG